MARKITRRGACSTGVAAVLAASALPARALTPLAMQASAKATRVPLPSQPYDTANGEWRTYGGNLGSWRYSALDQINAGNFNKLGTSWTFHPDNLGPTPDANLQATPLMVKGVLYLTAGSHRAAVAINAKTGEMLWKYNFDEGEREQHAARPGSGRGLSYWTDGKLERILFVTKGYQLVCLDARTGTPIADFGVNGVVDLKKDETQDIDPTGKRQGDDIGLHATPLIVGDVVVVGAAHLPSTNPHKKHIRGYVSAYDARSGKRLWIYHPIPRKGELGYDTWGKGSADYSGNAGNWAQNSADPELGLVYVGTEMPTDDWYAGERPGANLFGDCITALDARTGERVWYFQCIHHDMWDRDIPCASILCDLTVDGKKIKAIAQPSKQALLYVLDRVTGKPVWPIPEVKVPQGNMPGETYSPTQPIPTKPPPFDDTGADLSRVLDFTPALHAEGLKLLANYKTGPSLFEPPVVSKWPGPLAAISSPTGDGAGQWPGGAFDPETNMLYIFSNMAVGAKAELPADPNVTDEAYMAGQARDPNAPPAGGRGGGGGRLAVQGLPIFKPPYGRITAYDMNKGEIVWQVAHGETPDEVRNNPALKGINVPRTGNLGKVGVLVTKTLVIAGDGTATTGKDGKLGGWLRAYDKMTGKEVGAVPLPTRVTGSPMTYLVDGQQYIAVACSGGMPGQLVSLRVGVAAPAPGRFGGAAPASGG